MPRVGRACVRDRFLLPASMGAALGRDRETSAKSPSKKAAKILRRFALTRRSGRPKLGNSTSTHLIMAMDLLAARATPTRQRSSRGNPDSISLKSERPRGEPRPLDGGGGAGS